METAGNEGAKKSYFVPLIIVLVLIILVLLFLISPLSELVFPPDTEPTLALAVVEKIGPDPATGLYRVVVKAEVDGKPEPQVSFNRNDGVGEVKDNHTLLLLEEEETFHLKALASNPRGTAEAELELFGGIMVGASTGQTGPAGSPGPGAGGDNGDEETPPPAGNGGTGNRAPSIIDIGIYGESIIDRLEESFPILYEERRHSFSVLVEDNDDDEIEIEVEVSHGVVVTIGEGMWDGSRPPNLRAKRFSWQSPANPPGNLEPLNVRLTIIASDPSGASDRKIIKIALLPEGDEPANQPPVISGIDFSDSPLRAGQGYTATARASDPDGDSLIYSWKILRTRRVIEEFTGNPIEFTAPRGGGSYEFKVTVNDGRGGEDEYSKTVVILP